MPCHLQRWAASYVVRIYKIAMSAAWRKSAQFSGTVKTAHGDAIPRSACVPSGIRGTPAATAESSAARMVSPVPRRSAPACTRAALRRPRQASSSAPHHSDPPLTELPRSRPGARVRDYPHPSRKSAARASFRQWGGTVGDSGELLWRDPYAPIAAVSLMFAADRLSQREHSGICEFRSKRKPD